MLLASIVFKYVNNQCLNYLNEVFQTILENNIQTRGSLLKLKSVFRKTNADKMDTLHKLKQTKNLNTFKHNLKKRYLKEFKSPSFR